VTIVTDAGLASLVKIQPNLRRIDLGQTRSITHAGIAHLAKLPRLEELVLHSSRFDDAAAAAIARLDLRRLSLHHSVITDAGAAQLASMKRLEHLDLSWSYGVTDAGVAHLAKCLTLKSLNVTGARGVTDETLRKLADLPLESLNLTSYGYRNKHHAAQFTDRGLAAPAAMPTLKRVVLIGAQRISREGVAHLRIATTAREVIREKRR